MILMGTQISVGFDGDTNVGVLVALMGTQTCEEGV